MNNLSVRQRFIVLLAVIGAIAATPAPKPDPAIVANAEKEFARDGLEHGIRAAFLNHFAADAIVFEPGPTNARQHYTDYEEKGLALIWKPVFATISASGDFGVTTGPWKIKKSRGDTD